jgi:2-polyprenyl-6-methoxyphenol hydroxylase-like FAD-dependent oxidoreductase
MLALSQAATERLLQRALEEAGGGVERGVGVAGCGEDAQGVWVELKDSSGNQEAMRCPWLLAADGAHSTVRAALGVAFEGRSFNQKWHLADAPLATELDPHWAHVFFLKEGGFLFLIRVVDEAFDGLPGGPLWRVMGNRPDFLEHLVGARVSGESVWTSSFHVAHRINAQMRVGQICFAGDAAHVHSPMGARGMNLGIEDAWVFARCVREGRLEGYGQLRRPVDRAVVRRVELLSRIVSGETGISRFVRGQVLPRVVKLPWLPRRFVATIAGLDHEVEGL